MPRACASQCTFRVVTWQCKSTVFTMFILVKLWKVKSLASPDAGLIGAHQSLPLDYNSLWDGPWRDKHVQEHKHHTYLIHTGQLVNCITKLKIHGESNWSAWIQSVLFGKKHPWVIFEKPVVPSGALIDSAFKLPPSFPPHKAVWTW